MPTTTLQRQRSEALNQEAANLRTIAERLGTSIERFEAFMASRDVELHAKSLQFSSPTGELPEDCQQLARKLQEERKQLIAAWEQLERDQRDLLKRPERSNVGAESPPPKTKAQKRDSTVLPPATLPRPVSESNISKRLQFQHLQREIDRRR